MLLFLTHRVSGGPDTPDSGAGFMYRATIAGEFTLQVPCAVGKNVISPTGLDTEEFSAMP